MLTELRVRELGVIEDLTVTLEGGMTALTGETGAGKTLIVDAIELLAGGPADPAMVRPGGTEAVVEGRFVIIGEGGEETETILARHIPAHGRSRSYVDGRMVSLAQLGEIGASLIDLHGQHAHQSLLSSAAQRSALDRSAGLSTAEVGVARRHVREVRAELETLGGDQRARLREIEMLKFQLDEMDAAALDDPGEDDLLRIEEQMLGDASGLRLAAGGAQEVLVGDDGAADVVGRAASLLSGREPLDALHKRVVLLLEELADVSSECRSFAEGIDDDPARLEVVSARRKVLADLRRKYGDTLSEVISFREEVRDRVVQLSAYEERAARLEATLAQSEDRLRDATVRLWQARVTAAGELGSAVEARLGELAMPKARFEVTVGEERGSDQVVWMLSANPGEALLPLTKVASGGELARTMLATRLAIGPGRMPEGHADGPATLIFDEVDAGVGGEAAVAVGGALASLATAFQVLVVTHLPQVAASADHQLVVAKATVGDRTVASVRPAVGSDRVVELSRMLSGSPDSKTARSHAEELLSRAEKSREGSTSRGSRLG